MRLSRALCLASQSTYFWRATLSKLTSRLPISRPRSRVACAFRLVTKADLWNVRKLPIKGNAASNARVGALLETSERPSSLPCQFPMHSYVAQKTLQRKVWCCTLCSSSAHQASDNLLALCDSSSGSSWHPCREYIVPTCVYEILQWMWSNHNDPQNISYLNSFPGVSVLMIPRCHCWTRTLPH